MDLVLKRNDHIVQPAEATGTNSKLWLVFVHVLFWLIFLSLPAIFNPRRHGMSVSMFVDDLSELPRWSNGLLLIAIYYFNYYIAIPVCYVRRQYFLLVAFFVVWFSAFFLLNYFLMPQEVRDASYGAGIRVFGNGFNLFMFLIVYITSYAVCLYEQWQKIKEEKLSTEILFLKSQINPHFLFNTLNSIYSLSITQPEKAPDAIVKLSGLMRYTVSETDHDTVSLSKEISYINNYIDLQTLRLSGNVSLSYDIKGAADGQQIAPFLLIPFVENAFKFGVNADEESRISINIEVEEDNLYLRVSNNKVYIRPDKEHGTHLGISTTKRRLNLLYPGRHKLVIEDGAQEFTVSLTVKMHV